MAIAFHPRAGQMLVADFSDLSPPEICKVRPVIVVSPRLPFRSGLVAVVPVSLTPPARDVAYVYPLSKNYHPASPDDLPCWAKCDLVMNIALRRLNGFKIGRRQWATPAISPDDLVGVRRAVAAGLGFQI